MTYSRATALAVFLLLASLVAGAAVAPALAQGSDPTDDDVNRVAKQLYCPVCENVPLDVCPTQACTQWREVIRDRLTQGWTDEQIKTYFVEQYGDRVLATPPAEGLNWLVYIIPPLAILGGAGLLAVVMRNWRASAVEPHDSDLDSDDPYVEMLEQELRARDGS